VPNPLAQQSADVDDDSENPGGLTSYDEVMRGMAEAALRLQAEGSTSGVVIDPALLRPALPPPAADDIQQEDELENDDPHVSSLVIFVELHPADTLY
jgi:hypothetical protein